MRGQLLLLLLLLLGGLGRLPAPSINRWRGAPPAAAPQGTSRGNAKMPAIVERLRLWGINQL